MYTQPSQPYGLLIRVDPEVRAAIEALRQPGESIRCVLRRIFGLPPHSPTARRTAPIKE